MIHLIHLIFYNYVDILTLLKISRLLKKNINYFAEWKNYHLYIILIIMVLCKRIITEIECY